MTHDSSLQPVPTPLLTYAVGTQPLPLQASPATGTPPQSTLTLLATNGSGQTVTLQALQVTLPVGAGADDLTQSAPPAWMVPAGWTQKALNQGSGLAVYTFEPGGAGAGAVAAGQALAFVLNGVQVNAQPGTFQVQVTEGSGGCSLPDCPVASIPVTKVPAGGGVVSFWASPTTVSPGGSTVLGWSGPAGATYTLSYFDPERGQVAVPAAGQPPLAYSGEYPGPTGQPLTLQATTVFTLNVSMAAAGGENWMGQQQTTVVVADTAPSILSFSGALSGPAATPSLTLTWTTENALTCQISGVAEQLATSGSYTLDWPLEQSYTLTAIGPTALTAEQTVGTPPIITSFAGTCAPGVSGVELTLAWEALSADSCTISNVAGTFDGPSGSATVSASAASPLLSTYTLTAVNTSGTSTAAATVQWGPTARAEYRAPVMPSCGALSPDGTRVYLCGFLPPDQTALVAVSISPIQQAVAPVEVAATPTGLAVSPDGGTVLTTTSDSDTSSGAVSAYDAATLALVAGPRAVGARPNAICISPDGTQAFIPSLADSSVYVIDASTLQQAENPLSVDGAPAAVAVAPSGSTLYAMAYPVEPGPGPGLQSWVLDASGWVSAGSAVAGPLPVALAPSPDGQRLYTLCMGGNNLCALDAQTLQPVLPALSLQGTFANQQMAVSPDGARLFVGWSTITSENPQGTVTVVDTATLEVAAEITGFDSQPAVTAVTPDGAVLVVVTVLGSVYAILPAGYSA